MATGRCCEAGNEIGRHCSSLHDCGSQYICTGKLGECRVAHLAIYLFAYSRGEEGRGTVCEPVIYTLGKDGVVGREPFVISAHTVYNIILVRQVCTGSLGWHNYGSLGRIVVFDGLCRSLRQVGESEVIVAQVEVFHAVLVGEYDVVELVVRYDYTVGRIHIRSVDGCQFVVADVKVFDVFKLFIIEYGYLVVAQVKIIDCASIVENDGGEFVVAKIDIG